VTQEKRRMAGFQFHLPHPSQSPQKGIAAPQPGVVLLAGTAFGMNHDKHRIGDILVLQRLQLYDLQRIGADQIALCSDTYPIHPRG
jgi:hypothetical protein